MIDYSKFEVITFDCYGTLIDWETGLLAAFRYAARDHLAGIADETILAAYAEVEAELESGDYMTYREILDRAGTRVIERLGSRPERSNAGFLAASLVQWNPFADSVAALRRLRQRFRLGVISNIDRELFTNSNVKLGGPFTYVMTAEDFRSYKPSHNNFLSAEKIMKVPRERWLHAAQSLYHDAKPCNELGITSVWIDRRRPQLTQSAVKTFDAKPDAEFKSLKAFADAACI